MRWRRWLRATLWMVLALSGSTTQAIELADITSERVITPQLSILREREAGLTLTGALASPSWESIQVGLLKEGYSVGAFWLRGELRNNSAHTVTRWLAMGSARLEDVRLWLLPLPAPDAPIDEAATLPLQAGTRHPLSGRAVASHVPLFPVTLMPGERRQLILRVRSDSLLDLQVSLWESAAFRQEEGRELALQALMLGLSLLLATYALIQGIVWNDHGFVLMAGWIVAALAYICSFQGYLYRYLLDDGGPWLVHTPATLGCLTTLLYLRMSYGLVELRRLRPWRWLYQFTSVVLAVVTLWTALGEYRQAAPVANGVAALCYLLWIASMLHGWRHGLDNARMLVLSFALAWGAIAAKMLELNGLLAQSLLPDWHFAALFQTGLLCMTSLLVVCRALALHRQHEQLQWAMLYMRVREQLKLEQTVAERTLALSEALQAADEANRAKTGFLTRISHDLRTPLTSILGFGDMLQGGGDAAAYGRIIVRSARHMLAMVNDLIDYARGDQLDTPQPAPLYLHALLNAIGQEGAELARRQGNAFSLQIDAALPAVLVLDGKRLHRILGNLLDNAAKYTRHGHIGLRACWHAGGTTQEAGILEIEVSDDGCGIPIQHQARIFEPFERADADRSQPGIGMGLAIVRQWITRMGGIIALDSAPGRGTRMQLRLPAPLGDEHDLASHHVQEDTSMRPLIDGSGYLVLVVEDNPEIARLLDDQLSRLGFAVETCADGVAAMARMEQRTLATADLVLTDYLMPGANGAQVLQAARRLWPRVPVLLLSATLNAGQAAPAGDHFDARLLKPLNFLELQEAMGRLLGLTRPEPVASPEPAAQMSLPPLAVLRDALALIELGAVSDLLEWCDTLGREYPHCAAFHRQASLCIERSDLAALEALCRMAR